MRFMGLKGILKWIVPSHCRSLEYLPDEKRIAVKDTFKEMYFWVMSVKEHPAKNASEDDVPFSVKADMSDGNLNFTISGRLDTLTAPELLSLYQAKSLKGDIKSITIDSGSLTYISSAGLRVFLIMRKDLREEDQFQIKNIRKNVKEILDITGFSSLFIYEDNDKIS